MDWLQHFKPAVPKNWLRLLAGMVWSGVGVYLIFLAQGWIFASPRPAAWFHLLAGLVLAGLIFQFGFSKLALKNSRRIDQIAAADPCLFAFQEWHSYPLVLVMISLGIILRKYSPLPKPWLGILYLGIGGGLGSASLLYYAQILKKLAGSGHAD